MASQKETKQLSLFDWTAETPVDGLLSPEAIYHLNDQTRLMALGEDHRFERKGNRVDSRGLAECLSAFGNCSNGLGGVVAIGISDGGHIEGCSNLDHKRLAELEQMGHANCPTGKFSSRRVEITNQNGHQDFIILRKPIKL